MKATVYADCVRVEVEKDIVLEFKRLGDLNLKKTPIVRVGPLCEIISAEYKNKKKLKLARECGLEELATNMWGAR
jgi:hypothetical protein